MAFELVIVVIMGVAGAGTFAIVARLLRLPGAKRFIPLVAALSMVSYQVWARYTWADRTVQGLPPGSVALAVYPKSNWLEPWTFVVPVDGSVLVFDGTGTMTHPGNPGWKVVTTKLYEQYQDTLSIQHLVDCVGKRRAVVAPEMEFDARGLPARGITWIENGEPPELFHAACGQT